MRTMAIVGDSISTFEGCNPSGWAVFYTDDRAREAGLSGPHDTWWSLLADSLGARVAVNASYSGSMVAGAGFPAGRSHERAQALLGFDLSDVVVFLGTNDYGWGSARAQVCGRSVAAPTCVDLADYPPEVAGAASESGLAEFESAYSEMLSGIRDACPDARVWCVSLLPGRVAGAGRPTFAWNLRGIPLNLYNAAISRSAERTGCTFADAASFGLDYEAIEGTHPTALGMRQIAALAYAAIEGLSAPEPKEFDGDVSSSSKWASRVLCPERACLGCDDARGVGNAWYCVCERQVRRG